MRIVEAYTSGDSGIKISQLPVKRSWMDQTFDKHAYQCFPISLSNRLGWGISYPKDISFIWDGVTDTTPDHVTVLSGEEYVHTKRGSQTVSFFTDLTFFAPDNEDWSILTMPVPNQFIRGAQCMTTILSPTALDGELPIAWMVTEPNIEITIPAGTPIASVLPVSLSYTTDHHLYVKKGSPPYHNEEWSKRMKARSEKSMELNQAGFWTKFYRNAVDHNGESLGGHEVNNISMGVHYEF